MGNNAGVYVWLFVLIIVEILRIFIDFYRSRKIDKVLSQLADKKNLKEFNRREVTTPEKTVRNTKIKFWREGKYKGIEEILKEDNGKKRKH